MKRTPLYNFLFYLFISISIFLIIIKPTRFVNSVRVFFSYIFDPSFVFKPLNYTSDIYEKMSSLILCSFKIKKFSDENFNLKSKMVFMESLINENRRFSEIIGLKKNLSHNGVFARIVSINVYNPYVSAYIDKGKNDGISLYNPVLSLLNGRWLLIGRVSEVYDNFSKIIFITAPGFSFIVDTNSSRGLLTSDGKKLIYKFIEGDLKLGDAVYSSKISLTFPPFLYVGNVVEIKGSSEFRNAYIDGFKLKDIDIVYVIDFKPYSEALEERL